MYLVSSSFSVATLSRLAAGARNTPLALFSSPPMKIVEGIRTRGSELTSPTV